MTHQLKSLQLPDFKLRSGKVQDVYITYQLYGRELHTAPVILVNHALTGNSSVLEWWGAIVGHGRVIDLDRFTVLALDIPGDGHDGNVDHLIYNYRDWSLHDVGHAFAKALQQLGITQVDMGMGGSIGGGLLWEMVAINPDLFKTIVPIAADWKATDWLIACCTVQGMILENSNKPLHDARAHAMTFYRSPEGLKEKFNRTKRLGEFEVANWLNHHGTKLKNRFTLPSYRLMNHLLMTLDAAIIEHGTLKQKLTNSSLHVDLIAIDSDGFFLAKEDLSTYEQLKKDIDISYHEIKSVHGHDAFLIEHEQVSRILEKILQKQHFKETELA